MKIKHISAIAGAVALAFLTSPSAEAQFSMLTDGQVVFRLQEGVPDSIAFCASDMFADRHLTYLTGGVGKTKTWVPLKTTAWAKPSAR